jgi:hypothetical protein
VPSLVQGRIVYPKVPVPDPQGQNPKPNRPFVVISTNDDIAAGERIEAIGITGELDPSTPDLYVPLKYGPHAKTGLTKRCAAHCRWLITILPSDVAIGKGHVSAEYVEQIIEKVNALHP